MKDRNFTKENIAAADRHLEEYRARQRRVQSRAVELIDSLADTLMKTPVETVLEAIGQSVASGSTVMFTRCEEPKEYIKMHQIPGEPHATTWHCGTDGQFVYSRATENKREARWYRRPFLKGERETFDPTREEPLFQGEAE